MILFTKHINHNQYDKFIVINIKNHIVGVLCLKLFLLHNKRWFWENNRYSQGAYIASLGHKVLFIDTDPQGSLSMWFEMRENNIADNTIDLISLKPTEDITKAVKNLKIDYDFILVDTPPHASKDPKRIITSSDYVIIPTQLSPLIFGHHNLSWIWRMLVAYIIFWF